MTEHLDIHLMGKDYRVACPAAERASLQDAVAFLDARLKDLAAKTRSSGERLAVMAALNLAHELLAATRPPAGDAAAIESENVQRTIDSIESRLSSALAQHEQLF